MESGEFQNQLAPFAVASFQVSDQPAETFGTASRPSCPVARSGSAVVSHPQHTFRVCPPDVNLSKGRGPTGQCSPLPFSCPADEDNVGILGNVRWKHPILNRKGQGHPGESIPDFRSPRPPKGKRGLCVLNYVRNNYPERLGVCRSGLPKHFQECRFVPRCPVDKRGECPVIQGVGQPLRRCPPSIRRKQPPYPIREHPSQPAKLHSGVIGRHHEHRL